MAGSYRFCDGAVGSDIVFMFGSSRPAVFPQAWVLQAVLFVLCVPLQPTQDLRLGPDSTSLDCGFC
jgi:hypothetical protein